MDQAVAGPSFAERKAGQLAAERAGQPEAKARPEPTRERAPGKELESAESEPILEDVLGDEVDDEDELEAVDPDGTLEGDETDDDIDDSTNWRERYEQAQRKISEVTANRSEMDREHAEIMSTHINLKHELQDSLTEAKQFAQAYVGGFQQQIQQLEHAFQNGLIEPQNLPQARQQHQMFVQQRNQIQAQIEGLNQKEQEVKQKERERQAEIARVRLSRSIPGWSREVHRELGEYAQSRGFSAEEFGQNLDYRFLELLHDSMQLNRADSAVRGLKHKRKAKGPVRNAQTTPRSADGRYRQAEKAFRENPGEKGRFADMKMRQLQKEHRGR